MKKGLHLIEPGAFMSAGNSKLGSVSFPCYLNDNTLVGNMTGEGLRMQLRDFGYDVVDFTFEPIAHEDIIALGWVKDDNYKPLIGCFYTKGKYTLHLAPGLQLPSERHNTKWSMAQISKEREEPVQDPLDVYVVFSGKLLTKFSLKNVMELCMIE